MEELLLWRWSTGIQTASVLLISAFLSLGQRREGGAALADWARAWQWNCVALLVTWYYWLIQPAGTELALIRLIYGTAKTAFLVYLIAGVMGYAKPLLLQRSRQLLWAIPLIYAFATAVFLETVAAVGVVQSALIALACLAATALALSRPGRGLEWLALGFALRGLLGVVEAYAYGISAVAAEGELGRGWSLFLAAHSSMDLVAEWTLALGCVLALASRAQRELSASNEALRRSEAALRQQAERDALTGLYNRHALNRILSEHSAHPSCLLFFDLDDFKRINDEHGHAAGDACLSTFAASLRRHFDSQDSIIRFAGDEFLVVTRQTDPAEIERAVQRVADELDAHRSPCAVGFSVGRAILDVGGDAREAMRRADTAMYQHKSRRERAD